MIKEKALAHNLSLGVQTAEEMQGLEIMADERRLKQVMFNLLSNAAKFTPDGGLSRSSPERGTKSYLSVSRIPVSG